EPRFRPSPIAAVRSAGKLLGRKTSEGFYRYADGQKQVPVEPAAPSLPGALKVWLAPFHSVGHRRAAALLKSLGATVVAAETPPDDAVIVVAIYGDVTASEPGCHEIDGDHTEVMATLFGLEQVGQRVLMCSVATSPTWRDAAHALFATYGTAVSVIDDSSGVIGQ